MRPAPSPLTAPPLPAFLALVRLDDGSALARALPAWALSPKGKIDFGNTSDMLDLLDAACAPAEKAAPEIDLSSGTVYGIVQGARKLAVGSLSSEPMERSAALRLLESFPDELYPSPIARIASLEEGPCPIPRERSLRLTPGLERALIGLDCVGQAHFSLAGDEGDDEPAQAGPEQIRQLGLSIMENQLHREREERLRPLQERRALRADLKSADREKTALAIFLPEHHDVINTGSSMHPEHAKSAIALPLSELLGGDWAPPGRLRPDDPPAIAAKALAKAQEAWLQFPNAKDSCAPPASASCGVIGQRLVVILPLNQLGVTLFSSEKKTGDKSRAIRDCAWIMGLGPRVAVSSELPEDAYSAERGPLARLWTALAEDGGFLAEVDAMDLSRATPSPATAALGGQASPTKPPTPPYRPLSL